MTDDRTVPNPIWEADSTHPAQAEQLRAALREVVDPEIGMSIIELGLIREVKIEPEQVQMKMILTTPFCPYGPAMLEMTRSKASESAGKPAVIELGMEMWDPSMMEEGAGAAWGF
jgi:metal-sulfur cluster biosynthetic enzyme